MDTRIWQKDDFFKVGSKRIDMDPSVVQLPEKVDVFWNFDHARPSYGSATNIRLEDGEIFCDLELFDEKNEAGYEQLKDDVRLAGYYTGVEKNDDGSVVTSCDLRAISFILVANAPGFPKEN